MPLTLRPTGLSRDPDSKDWCVYDGGPQPVGRIYEDQAAPSHDARRHPTKREETAMPNEPSSTTKGRRRLKARKFYKTGPDFRTGGAPPYQFGNRQKLAMGQLVIGPPPGRRGFPDFPEAPLILVNKKSHRSLRDLENCGTYWLISEWAKQVLEQVDPDAFAFVKCEVRFATGEPGPDYWLCDVVRVLDAVDEAASRFDVFSFSSSLVFREDTVGSARIFRMSQRKTDVICDQSVKDACKAAGLKGFSFKDAADLQWLSTAEIAKRRLDR